MKPFKDAPLKCPIDEDPIPSIPLSQPEIIAPTTGASQLLGESQTVSSLTVSQQSVTVPSPPNSMSSTIDSTTTVQNPLLLHPPTHTYLTTGEY
jgi:hypothetical protein